MSSSYSQTRTASSMRQNGGRNRLMVRQPKRGGRGVEVVITTPDGEMLKYGVQLKFPATNNMIKYEGILMRLRLGKALRAKNLLVQSDSKQVIR